MSDIRKLRRHGMSLDAEVIVFARWRGGEIDRLLDEGHAAIVGWLVTVLTDLGWQTRTEVSYSEFGERGSIDILAWHAESRILLVVEVKTELTSIEETLRKHDEKQRLGAGIAHDRFAWDKPTAVCRMLVLPDTSTQRRRVSRHNAVLSHAYRLRSHAARSWLRSPDGSVSLLIFTPVARGARGMRGCLSKKRVRRELPSAATPR
jgi:hypothetical protein